MKRIRTLFLLLPFVLAACGNDTAMNDAGSDTDEGSVTEEALEDAGVEDAGTEDAGPADDEEKQSWSLVFRPDEYYPTPTLTLDSAGNVLLSAESLLVKLNPAGKVLWEKPFGGSVSVDGDDNVIVTGEFSEPTDFGDGELVPSGLWDMFVAKYNPDGTHVWSRRFGAQDGSDTVSSTSVVTDSDGAVVIGGLFSGTAELGGDLLSVVGGLFDGFVLKVDANGDGLWTKHIGGTTSDAANDVAVDAWDNVIVAGQFGGTINLGGEDLTGVGGSSFGVDTLFAKFAADGQHIWSKRYGGNEDNMGMSISTDSSGNLVLSGFFWDTMNVGGDDLTANDDLYYDFYVAKFDSDASHIWSTSFGGAGNDSGYIRFGHADRILVFGGARRAIVFGDNSFEGAADEGGFGFLAKYDASGNHLWSEAYGVGVANVHIAAVAQGSNESNLIAGRLHGTTRLGEDEISSGDDYVLFIYRFITP